jgi:hypothetical protein
MLKDGEEHARVRKHLHRFFNADNVASVVDGVGAEMRALVAAVESAATGAPGKDLRLPPGVEVAASGGAEGSDGSARVDAFHMAAMSIMRVVFRVRQQPCTCSFGCNNSLALGRTFPSSARLTCPGMPRRTHPLPKRDTHLVFQSA